MSETVRDEVFGKLAWLFVLLPGFVCTAVVGYVVELPELSELQLTGFSLIASLACALIAWPLLRGIGRYRARRIGRAPADVGLPQFFTTCFLIAPFLGLYFGQALQDGAFLRLFGRVPGITLLDKASSKRPLVFLLGLNNRGQMNQGSADMRNERLRTTSSYARFRMKENGPTYEGWPLYFAHGTQTSEIYVSPACRIDEKGAATVLPGPGVLIIEGQLQAVEFIDKADSACRKAVMAGTVASSAGGPVGCATSSACAASAPAASAVAP